MELLGLPAVPGQLRIVYALPATQRTRIDDKWADRVLLGRNPAAVPMDTRNLL